MDENWPKRIQDNFRSSFGWKSTKESGQGEGEIERWKTCKVDIVFEEAIVGAKGVRAFATRTYFPTHPKTKLYPSCREGGTLEEESEGSKGVKGIGPKV